MLVVYTLQQFLSICENLSMTIPLFTVFLHQETSLIVVITEWNNEFEQQIRISVDIYER